MAERENMRRQELWVTHHGKRVYGVLYVPRELEGLAPAIVFSHPFGSTHRSGADCARAMTERGYVVYAFDFCGGAYESRSTGETTECSILTEAKDLSAVLDAVRELDCVDASNVFLVGKSQGAAVSAIVAGMRPNDVAGLALMYPAFVIHDDMVNRFGTADDVPNTFVQWHRLGRVYAVDAIGYDFYEHIGDYTGPVLLFHGDADSIVPLRYSERAAQTYANVDFEVIHGAGHAFDGSAKLHVLKRIGDFVEAHKR